MMFCLHANRESRSAFVHFQFVLQNRFAIDPKFRLKYSNYSLLHFVQEMKVSNVI